MPVNNQLKDLSSKLDLLAENQTSLSQKVDTQKAMLEEFMARTEVSLNLLVQKICQSSSREDLEDLVLDEKFPISSIQEIEDLEHRVREDQFYKKKLVNILCFFFKCVNVLIRQIFVRCDKKFKWVGVRYLVAYDSFCFIRSSILSHLMQITLKKKS